MAVVKEELETARKLVVLLEGKTTTGIPFFEKGRGRNKESFMSQRKQLPDTLQTPKQTNIDLHVYLLAANRKARNNEKQLTIANERIRVLTKTVEDQKHEIENYVEENVKLTKVNDRKTKEFTSNANLNRKISITFCIWTTYVFVIGQQFNLALKEPLLFFQLDLVNRIVLLFA